ncbi:MAG: DUF1294 domain-containing protein [Planctomycetota bacterium]
MHQFLTIFYAAWVGIASLITFCVFGWDKRQAKRNQWRVPEDRLHFLTMIGGWPGALIGQQWFRHKTQKVSFKIMIGLAVILHAGIIWLLIKSV